MQAALACMHLCESVVLQANDIGEALATVKETLRNDDGELQIQQEAQKTLHGVLLPRASAAAAASADAAAKAAAPDA